MKKIILLALAALLIFTMVSCDGNADFLLWGDEATEKTITLQIVDLSYNEWSFDLGEEESYSVDITVSAEKWGDLVTSLLGYDLYNDYFNDYYSNVKFASADITDDQTSKTVMIITFDDDPYEGNMSISICTSDTGDNNVETTDEIVDGQTYYLFVAYQFS